MASKILKHAYPLVPRLGFKQSLLQSVRDAKYSDSAVALFPRAEYDLVAYHLNIHKQGLAKKFPRPTTTESHSSLYDRVKELLCARLDANKDLGSPVRIQEYLSILRQHPVDSLQMLHELSDEVLYLAGDNSSDASWYSRRLAVSSVYASAELIQSRSSSFNDYEWRLFVNKTLSELEKAETGASNVGEWLQFNAMAVTNVVRSLTR